MSSRTAPPFPTPLQEAERDGASHPIRRDAPEPRVLADYDCGHCCRLCPFPGAKCCQNVEETRNHVH